jgi:hypothetical protein
MRCLYNLQKDQMSASQIFRNFCSVSFAFPFLKLIRQIAIQKLKILNHFIPYIQRKV